jgi:hypothetical protein
VELEYLECERLKRAPRSRHIDMPASSPKCSACTYSQLNRLGSVLLIFARIVRGGYVGSSECNLAIVLKL